MTKNISITLSVSGMRCAGCVSSVEKALLEVSGVEAVTVNLPENTASVKGEASVSDLVQSLVDAGFNGSELGGA